MELLNLQLFNNTQTTVLADKTGNNDLSPEMKVFYSDYLIDNAKPALVHDQFAQKHPIPKNGGKTIEFRKYSPFAKATTTITEGVTPNGHKLNVSIVEATVEQYGDYVELSDVLLLTAIDNNMVQATELLGAQAGATLDYVTAKKLAETNSVRYAGGSTINDAKANVIKWDDILLAVRDLKNQNAQKIDGSYVAIINPDTWYSLMRDNEFITAQQYAGSTRLFEGELGKIGGVRFVETTETVKSEREASNGCIGTMVIGANAYGVTEVEGGGLQHIVKQLGSSGSADPLNQRATVGWKAIKTAEILVEAYMVRIISKDTNPKSA